MSEHSTGSESALDTSTEEAELVDTRDMIWVHGALRGEFNRLRADLPAFAMADSAAWDRYLAHWTLMYDFLVEHHTGEDRLLWPAMLERLPDEHEVINSMQSEHHTLHQLLEDCNAQVCSIGEARESTDTADIEGQCRDADEMLSVMMVELEKHLHDEETQFLPLVPGVLTTEEWGALSAEAAEILGERNALLVLGYILKWMDENERPIMLTKVPPPVAEIWAGVGSDEFEAYEAGLQLPATE